MYLYKKTTNFNFMPKKVIFPAIVLLLSLIIISWGRFGHEHINRSAVMALPEPLQSFFYNHIDFLTLESTVPDLRKSTLNDKSEGPKHYFDVENFGALDTIPRDFEVVKKRYNAEFLQNNGILPWYIQEMTIKLTKAFKEKRKTEILFIAGDLAHYLADAHMPLHTSANHDGQLTDQKGIHSLWETKIPDMFGNDYNFYTGEVKFIDNIEIETWRIMKESNDLSHSLLSIEKELRSTFPSDKIYEKQTEEKLQSGKPKDLVFSKEYIIKFNEKLNGMVEQQMRKSIQITANFWYTAWVNAGKPDLSKLDNKEVTNRNSKFLKKDLKLWKTGKLFGLEYKKEI